MSGVNYPLQKGYIAIHLEEYFHFHPLFPLLSSYVGEIVRKKEEEGDLKAEEEER